MWKILSLFLWAAFAFDVLREEQVLAVEDYIGEVGDPVAQDNHTGFLGELQIDFNMAMTVDEVIHVGVILDIFLGEQYQMFAVLAHIGRLFAVRTLHAAVLGPVQSKPHAPTGVE